MKKKMVSVLLTFLLGVSLCACSNGNTQADSSNTGSNESAQPTESSEESTENAATPGEVVKLVMAFPTWVGAPADTELVQEAMNEITREKLGIEIELQISDFGSFNQNMTLALSGGEQIDLLSCTGFKYANAVQQGYLLDVEANNLLADYGSDIITTMGEDYIDACRVGGVLYGLPNNHDIAQGHGVAVIATEYLEGIDYDVTSDSEIIHITEDELDDIYRQLHETYPDLEVVRPVGTSMQQFLNYDPVGGNIFGVLLDYGKELKVENLFTSDAYYQYCQKMYDYNQNGYISKDAATDTTAVSELVQSGVLMSHFTGGKPGIKVESGIGAGREVTVFQTGEDFVTSAAVASFPWTIPVTTANAEAAMRYLNELYINPDLANLLVWGIEGVHYQINDDGLATYADGVDAATSGWNHTMGWLMPNELIAHVWEGNDPDLWKIMDDFNRNAATSAASGFAFDSSNVATEIAAVQNIYSEYQASIEYGFTDPNVSIPEMNNKMMDAGLQKIIDEKQRQLDEWNANR